MSPLEPLLLSVTAASITTVWTYGLFDYDPEPGDDEEEWARELAEQGWRTWTPGPGPWITLEGRRLRRWSLRRD